MRGHYGKDRGQLVAGHGGRAGRAGTSQSVRVARPNSWWNDPNAVSIRGSVFGHTPGDVADELDELNSEIMQFDAELANEVSRVKAGTQANPDARRLLEESRALQATATSWGPLMQAVIRIEREMAENPNPQARLLELAKAQAALEAFVPRERRVAILQRINAISDQLSKLETPLPASLEAFRTAWEAFKWDWMRFHSHKRTVPAQTWPLSGTWDRTQEYRQQFREFYDKAPFSPQGAKPLDPSDRKDPSVEGGLKDLFGSIGTLTKVVIYGGLGLVGAVALVSIVQQVRKGNDPAERYLAMAQSAGKQVAQARSLKSLKP